VPSFPRRRGIQATWQSVEELFVTPAKAGVQNNTQQAIMYSWVPAFAGMTEFPKRKWIPAFAGMTCFPAPLRPLLALALLLCSCPAVAQDCAHCPEMVVIPAGMFVMGAAPGEEERESLAEEFRNRSQPQRSVSVRSFSAGKFEVTRGQYRAFAAATGRSADGCFLWTGTTFELDRTRDWRDPGYAQNDSHPVTCVSWEDAGAYTEWLSRQTGRKYRLLTEAEWEYAARAGSTTARYWGDDVRTSCSFANGADVSTAALVPGASTWIVVDCNDRHAWTAPVGSFRANAFGLHDMLGNVEEWTQDCWSGNLSGAPADGSARTAGDCALRAVRGGSWLDAPVGVRAAYRVGSPTPVRVYRRGFRVATDM
jgi:formylglycine-generating enzyme